MNKNQEIKLLVEIFKDYKLTYFKNKNRDYYGDISITFDGLVDKGRIQAIKNNEADFLMIKKISLIAEIAKINNWNVKEFKSNKKIIVSDKLQKNTLEFDYWYLKSGDEFIDYLENLDFNISFEDWKIQQIYLKELNEGME